jgi:hypothetical protein
LASRKTILFLKPFDNFNKDLILSKNIWVWLSSNVWLTKLTNEDAYLLYGKYPYSGP